MNPPSKHAWEAADRICDDEFRFNSFTATINATAQAIQTLGIDPVVDELRADLKEAAFLVQFIGTTRADRYDIIIRACAFTAKNKPKEKDQP